MPWLCLTSWLRTKKREAWTLTLTHHTTATSIIPKVICISTSTFLLYNLPYKSLFNHLASTPILHHIPGILQPTDIFNHRIAMIKTPFIITSTMTMISKTWQILRWVMDNNERWCLKGMVTKKPGREEEDQQRKIAKRIKPLILMLLSKTFLIKLIVLELQILKGYLQKLLKELLLSM